MSKPEDQRWAARALVLACMTIAMTILMVIIERTPLGMLALLVSFFGYSVYPIIYLTGFSDPTRRKERWLRLIITFAVVVAFTVGIGILFWPSPRIRILSLQPHPPQPDKPVEVNLQIRNGGRDAKIVIAYKVFFVDLLPRERKERAEMEGGDLVSEKNIDFCGLFQNQISVVPRCSHHNGGSND
jgi:hypothetical protein